MGVPQKPSIKRKADVKDPFPGTLINGKYRVNTVLASGGMGRIYHAEQVPLGRPVALKVLRTRYADEVEDDPQFQKRFFQEASILSKLQHNHIVTLYDYGRIEEGAGDQYFMAMELLRGETLAQRIRARGALPLVETLQIIRQIARGLNAAHRLEIVHRDLKPSNIMLVPEDDGVEVVKILDFGISKIATPDSEELTAEGAFLGSPRYMAPEQVSEGKIDARTDIYALGVILYECLCGRIPFDGETNIGIMMAHCNTPVPAMRDRNPSALVPECLEALALHCLQKGQAMRPRSMDDFLRELGACEVAISGGQPAVSLGSLALGGALSGAQLRAGGHNEATVSGTFSSNEMPAMPASRPSSAPTGTHRSLVKSQIPAALADARTAAHKRTTSPLVIGTLIASIGLVIGVGVFVVRNPRQSPQIVAPTRTSFTLTLESTPSNAEVREGDQLLGTTPLRLTIDHASAKAPRRFVVTHAGYAPYTVIQGDSTDDLRVIAALDDTPAPTTTPSASTAPTPSSAPSATATPTARTRTAPTTTTTARATNPDLDIKLKR